MPAFIPDAYMPDVHQRLFFYKRLAQAGTDEELDEIRAEIVDRCGDPPDEVDALCEVMAVKVRLRALRIRALEAGRGGSCSRSGDGRRARPLPARQARAGVGRCAAPHPRHEARDPPRGREARGRGAARPGGPSRAARTAQAVREAVAAAMPAAPTPAQEAAAGRELLRAAREALGELSRLARSDGPGS